MTVFQLQEVEAHQLPEELRGRASRLCAFSPERTHRFVCSHKSFWRSVEGKGEAAVFTDHTDLTGLSRGAAWRAVPIDPAWERNPWRKMHSRAYWCWYRETETGTGGLNG